jgi:hypothetical protein
MLESVCSFAPHFHHMNGTSTRVSSIEGISNSAYTKSCLWARICVRLCGRCWSLSPPREVILGPIQAQSVPISTNTRCVVDFLSPWTSLLEVVQGGEVESMKFRSKKVQGFSRMDLNGQCEVLWRSCKVAYATCIPFFWRSAYSEVTFEQNPERRYDPTSTRACLRSRSCVWFISRWFWPESCVWEPDICSLWPIR